MSAESVDVLFDDVSFHSFAEIQLMLKSCTDFILTQTDASRNYREFVQKLSTSHPHVTQTNYITLIQFIGVYFPFLYFRS